MLAPRQLAVLLIALLYVLSPLDVVPDFLPGIGWLDDLLVLGALAWYLASGRSDRRPWEGFRSRFGASRATRGGPPPEEFAADFSRMDPYALLEVSPQATAAEIKAAYRRAVARYHPDKVAHLGKEFQELAHRKLLAIRRAYEILEGEGR